ncbi:MAG: FAD-binding oxidoreductase [Azoarcus sp.]|nr:FAD-binding oxidoreductase [Azoarcus sp.]
MHTVVVGAGIVGLAAAWELLEAGSDVTLLDPAPIGSDASASYGNGSMISPAFMIPVSNPGLWRKVPGFLLGRDSPMSVRAVDFARLSTWAINFVLAGATEARLRGLAAALAPLTRGAPALHEAFSRAIGRPDLVQRGPLHYLYPHEEALEGDHLAWQLREHFGVEKRLVTQAELRCAVPNSPVGYKLGIVVPDSGFCNDTSGYSKAIWKQLASRGATWMQEAATGFQVENGRVVGVETSKGRLRCDSVVIAAGHASVKLAAALGDRVPLKVERGYSLQYRENPTGLDSPLMLPDKRIAITPNHLGVRVAGQVELAHPDAPPNWDHIRILHKRATEAYPELAPHLQTAERWMGRRPSMSDCKPVIGLSSGASNAIYAFGHAHIGLTTAPRTARIVVALMKGTDPEIPVRPFSPRRFRRTSAMDA